MKKWSNELRTMFVNQYPQKGKVWCIENLGISEGQARSMASRLGLKARGKSEAWSASCARHSKLMTGRKRPEQALVLKALHESGRLVKTQAQRDAVGARMRKYIQENGHPRGSLGLIHSDETKALISKASILSASKMTRAQKINRVLLQMKTKSANGTMVNPRQKATWKAGWRDIGGQHIYFRSRWEANYAMYLEWLRSKNEIAKWEHEPETFWFDGVKRGCVSYLPDFRVTLNSEGIEYHEVKGWMDARSATKIKRMRKYHPSVVLKVIDSKAYASIKKTMSKIIKEWEV